MTHPEIFAKIKKRLRRKGCLQYFKQHYSKFAPWLRQQIEIAFRDSIVKTDNTTLVFKDGNKIDFLPYSDLFQAGGNPCLFFRKITPGTAPKPVIEEIEDIATKESKEIEWLGYQNLCEWFLGMVKIKKVNSTEKSTASVVKTGFAESVVETEKDRRELRRIRKELQIKTSLDIRLTKLEALLKKKNPKLLTIFRKYNNESIFCFYSHNFFDAFWRMESHFRGKNINIVFEKFPYQEESFCWRCRRRGKCLIWTVPPRERTAIRIVANYLKTMTVYSFWNLKKQAKKRLKLDKNDLL